MLATMYSKVRKSLFSQILHLSHETDAIFVVDQT